MVEHATVYYDEDADLAVLDDRTVAVIGYGNQGRSQALNMRDSGVDVIVGNRGDDYRERAEADGFDAYDIPEAAARGDVLFLLVPDEVAPEVYEEHVEPNLEAGDALNFASGYNLTYDFIRPPADVDVVLVAPRMTGPNVRSTYEDGTGFPSVMAVERDATGDAKALALALAKAIGSTGAGVIEGTAEMETKIDLLTEQALVPLVAAAMRVKFEVETAHGIPPELVMTELTLSREIAEMFEDVAERGFLGQLEYHSMTSQYGQLSRMDEFDDEPMREFVEEQFRNIDNGAFAREWGSEQALDRPGLKRLYAKYRREPFFVAERETMERLGMFDGDRDGG